MLHLTERNFKTEVLEASQPTAVMFYARWCSKCAMMRPCAEELAKRFQAQYKFCEVEIDESEILAQSYGIDIVPAFLFFHNGQLLAGFSGLIDTDVLETRLHKIFRNC